MQPGQRSQRCCDGTQPIRMAPTTELHLCLFNHRRPMIGHVLCGAQERFLHNKNCLKHVHISINGILTVKHINIYYVIGTYMDLLTVVCEHFISFWVISQFSQTHQHLTEIGNLSTWHPHTLDTYFMFINWPVTQ